MWKPKVFLPSSNAISNSCGESKASPIVRQRRISLMVEDLVKIICSEEDTFFAPSRRLSVSSLRGSVKCLNRGCTEENENTYTDYVTMEGSIAKHDTTLQHSKKLQELQIFSPLGVKIFSGSEAFSRLSLMSPKSGKTTQYHHTTLNIDVDPYRLVFSTTIGTIVRCARGTTGAKGEKIDWYKEILFGKNLKPFNKHVQASARFYTCLCNVHLFFYTLYDVYVPHKAFLMRLCQALLFDMIENGRNQSPVVEWFLKELEGIILPSGTTFNKKLLSLPPGLRVALARSRRLFFSDVTSVIALGASAMDRMSSIEISPHLDKTLIALDHFNLEVTAWLKQNEPQARDAVDRASMSMSSAGMWFTRRMGGGNKEGQLMVGMYRLSKGLSTTLSSVYGTWSPNEDPTALLLRVQEDAPRQEIVSAALWFVRNVLIKSDFIFPLMVIFALRETKGRTFIRMPYALQVLCGIISSISRRFFKSRGLESFKGIKERKEFVNGARDFIARLNPQEVSEMICKSLDARVSTDGFHFSVSKKVYEPYYPYLPDWSEEIVDYIFSPMQIGVAEKPPRDIRPALGAMKNLGGGTGIMFFRDQETPLEYFTVRPVYDLAFWGIEPPVRLNRYRNEIMSALVNHRRVIMSAPTGSGKSILLAAITNCIIQCPGLEALYGLSSSLNRMNIPHNIYHGTYKSLDNMTNEKMSTILTTAPLVRELHNKFSDMLIVLDEAETPMESFILNINWTKRSNVRVLLMSATLEGIVEPETNRLSFNVESGGKVTCFNINFNSMISKLKNQMDEDELSMVITYSHPHCRLIAELLGEFSEHVVVSANIPNDELMEITSRSQIRVLVCTNTMRTSLTFPRLTKVYDIQKTYSNFDSGPQGFQQLYPCEVSPAQKKQAEGRVGRVAAGEYYTVTDPKKEAPHPHVPGFWGRPTELARDIDFYDPFNLSLPMNIGSLVIERFHQQFLARITDDKVSGGGPAEVRFIKKEFGEPVQNRVRWVLTRFVMFFVQGINTRMKGYEHGSHADIELFLLYQKACAETDPILSVAEFTTRLETDHRFPNEMNLTKKWSGPIGTEPYLLKPLVETLARIFWRTVCTVERKRATSSFRHFTYSSNVPDGHYIAIGLHTFASSVAVDIMLPIPTVTFQRLARDISEATEVVIKTEYVGVIDIVSIDAKGKPSWKPEVSYEDVTYEPNDLPRIIEILQKSARGCILEEPEPITTTIGCPMSSRISFPTLTSVSECAGSYLRALHKKFWDKTYGDDAAFFGHIPDAQLYTDIREGGGLWEKITATGIFPLSDNEGIMVFTERYYQGRSLKKIASLKPIGIVQWFKGITMDEVISQETMYPSDYKDVGVAIDKLHPGLVRRLTKDRKLNEDTSIPVRVTETRRKVAALISRFPDESQLGDRVIDKEELEDLVTALEAQILFITPSSKGSPLRVKREDGEVSMAHIQCSAMKRDALMALIKSERIRDEFSHIREENMESRRRNDF